MCTVLTRTGYLEAQGGDLAVTADGQVLRRLYAENDLLVAQCLRSGAWDGLDAPGLAAVVAAVVFEARREEGGERPAPPGGARLAHAVDETVRAWSSYNFV